MRIWQTAKPIAHTLSQPIDIDFSQRWLLDAYGHVIDSQNVELGDRLG